MKIILNRDVFENFQEIAKNAFPKEMFLFLEGKYDKKQDVMRIYSLAFQPYQAGNYHTLIRADLPLINDVIGTVHSHPGSTRPSSADIATWQRYGKVHFIIGKPYEEENLTCYDENGTVQSFSIS